MISKVDAKLKELEELITTDLSNGRHIQKKLQDKLKSCGACPNELSLEIKKLQLVK